MAENETRSDRSKKSGFPTCEPALGTDELAKANARLQAEIAEHRRTEKALRKTTLDLPQGKSATTITVA